MGKRNSSHSKRGSTQNDLVFARQKEAKAQNLASYTEQLCREENFLAYLKLLKRLAKRYTILVSANDTPVWDHFDAAYSEAFQRIGFKSDLRGKYRWAYAAVLDEGRVIFEQLLPDRPVSADISLGQHAIHLFSSGYGMNLPRNAVILVDGINCSQNSRGLNFVVYDKASSSVIDSVAFDTFAANYLSSRLSLLVNQLTRFREAHPDLRLVTFDMPCFPSSGLTANERFILETGVTRGYTIEHADSVATALRKYFDTRGVIEVLSTPDSFRDERNVRRFFDTSGEHVNIRGGHRVTAFQPSRARQTVFLVGGCTVFGVGTDDARTIASFLQKKFNENNPEARVIVQNYGFFLCETDRMANEELQIMEALPAKSGDIILFFGPEVPGADRISMAGAASEARDCELFCDTNHYTPDGYRLIAEKLFEGLQNLRVLEQPVPAAAVAVSGPGYDFTPTQSEELNEYKKMLLTFYRENLEPVVGAVVMNCNPFTLGHRYLIDEALKQCDYLAVFVVEEDKSFFPFEDRIDLVEANTLDLQSRVIIIPSGKFIISSLTFTDYFNKSEMQDKEIDASTDVAVFAREIAPCMHIRKRFAGEEPIDSVTRQYNETMRSILPEYGVEFVEIPRKTQGAEYISASQVRALLEKKDFDAIRPLVPDATFAYLMEKFGER